MQVVFVVRQKLQLKKKKKKSTNTANYLKKIAGKFCQKTQSKKLLQFIMNKKLQFALLSKNYKH